MKLQLASFFLLLELLAVHGKHLEIDSANGEIKPFNFLLVFFNYNFVVSKCFEFCSLQYRPTFRTIIYDDLTK